MYGKYIELISQKGIPYKENVSLSKYSSFEIGGPAAIAVFPENTEDIVFCVKSAKAFGTRNKIIGNGSNILFSDKGFDGVIIFTTRAKNIEVNKNTVTAECGASFTYLASVACKSSLSGLEFAYGIPGTVGGAVFMNAGAYGGEVSDVLVSSLCYDSESGNIYTLDKQSHKFDYRTGIYDQNDALVVLSATFELKEKNAEEIKSLMEDLMAKRRDKQPLEFPSAGSTFKRPEGHFAGKLIEDAGLKGYTVGGAQVSKKHAGFVINRGGATASDVLGLIEHIKNTVYASFGVMLECEIKYID